MAKQNALEGATKAELVKFIEEEIKETEEALEHVNTALRAGNLQFNAVYQRKRAEYSGVLWAYNAVLDLALDRKPEEVVAPVEESNAD